MIDSQPDLLQLNRTILLNPRAAASHPLAALLELEKPGMEILCPLARAIYWIETGRSERVDAGEALATLWSIDDSDARGDGEVCFKESAQHSIRLTLGEVAIVLGFESHAQMFYYGNFWHDGLRARSADAWGLSEQDDPNRMLEKLFLGFDADRRKWRGRTRANPREDGFVGECRYTFAFVNDLPVRGPSFTDSYHEQIWEDLSQAFPQRWDGDCHDDNDCGGDVRNSSFCWLHYLTSEQAAQLGIAAQADQAIGPGQDYPEWVAKQLVAQSDALWIHSHRIQSSYANAATVVEPTSDFWFAVGCGPSWDPADPAAQVDAEAEPYWDEFPEQAGPLLRIEISRTKQSLPPEWEALFPYLRQLIALL